MDLQLEVRDGLLAIDCEYPSDDDIASLPRVWLTGNDVPWDPRVLDEDDGVVIPPCWDGVSPLTTVTENTWNELCGYSNYLKFMSCQQRMVQTVVEASGLLLLANMLKFCTNSLCSTAHKLNSRVMTPSVREPKRDYEKYRPMLGWFPLETVRRTFCLLYTSPSPRDLSTSRMPSSA